MYPTVIVTVYLNLLKIIQGDRNKGKEKLSYFRLGKPRVRC